MSTKIEIDRDTLANIAAFAVIVGYVAFMVIRPTFVIPEELKSLAQICIGFLFTGAGYSAGIKIAKMQAQAIADAKKASG
jgi:hypothetical protein